MKWRNLAHSGFWRWYAVSRCDEEVADDGSRRVELAAPVYGDRLGMDASVAADGTVRRVSARLSMSWIREDSPASVPAIVCIASLLRSLEPEAAFVWQLREALLSEVGLGRPWFTESDGSDEITLRAVGDAVLGRTDGLQVALARGRLLRVLAGPAAVAIEWLAVPIDASAPGSGHPEEATWWQRAVSSSPPMDPRKLGYPHSMSWEIIPMTARPVDLAVGAAGEGRGMDKVRITPNGQLLEQSATLRLVPHPTSVRAAREFVASTLRDWGWTEHVATAVLLTSELVTNAIVHAQSDVGVTLRGEPYLRVEVSDEGVAPVRPDPRGGGRGLWLVEALAAVWGVRPEERGKTVWFELGP